MKKKTLKKTIKKAVKKNTSLYKNRANRCQLKKILKKETVKSVLEETFLHEDDQCKFRSFLLVKGKKEINKYS